MGGYPDLVFIIDTYKESLAIAEAKKLKIPLMGIVDTNCNPDNINYVIPANDDSAKTIKLICNLISEAAIAGTKENMALAGVNLEKAQAAKSEDKKLAVKRGKKETVVAKEEEKAPTAKKAAEKKPAAKKAAPKAETKVEAKKEEK